MSTQEGLEISKEVFKQENGKHGLFEFFSDVWFRREYYGPYFESFKNQTPILDKHVLVSGRKYDLYETSGLFNKKTHIWGYENGHISSVLSVEEIYGNILLRQIVTESFLNRFSLVFILDYYIDRYKTVYLEVDENVKRFVGSVLFKDGCNVTVVDARGNEHPSNDFETLFWTSPIDFMCSYVKISKK